MAFAGIDVGTSGCKMVVYNLKGEILAESKRVYEETGTNGYRELDAVTVWNAVKETIRESATASTEWIECLCIASLGESIICTDDNNNVLCGSMLTGDKRGIAECKKIKQHISKQEVMNITGLPVSEMYSLPKFLWIRENTDIFQKASAIFFFEDYIGFKLTGQRKISYSSAARSMAFDIKGKEWSTKLLSLAGLTSQLFSEPVSSGTILGTLLPETAEALGLSPLTVVAAGGHDQGCAGLGSGMIKKGQGEDGQGTCEVMQFILPEFKANNYMIEKGIPCAPYVLPDMYLAQIELTTCGILMNWTRDILFANIKNQCKKNKQNFFSYMDNRVTDTLPGELLILPSFGSRGNPDVSYNSRGTIWGLTIHSTPEEIYQAIKEGMAYQMYLAYETLEPLGINADVIRITGGGSCSDYTLQLRADIFDIPMETVDKSQAGTLGCAILAAKAIHPEISYEGLLNDMLRVKKTFLPRSPHAILYHKHFNQFKTLYNLLTNFASESIMKV